MEENGIIINGVKYLLVDTDEAIESCSCCDLKEPCKYNINHEMIQFCKLFNMDFATKCLKKSEV